jgi:dienelactone hydrolase
MTMSRARVIATQAVRHGPASRRLAQRRWLAGAAAVVALLTVGTSCSGTGESAANPVASSRAAAAPDPTERCGMSVPGEKVVMTAEDGVTIAAARFGTGPHGLVLVPQRANDLCGWARHIPALADSGLHVLAFDPRCTGYSDCPADDVGRDLGGDRDYAADVGAALDELRRQGATKVAVMGASLGAVTAFVAAGRYPDKVTGVVGLSIFNASFTASRSHPRSATDAAPLITAPILLCLAEMDSSSIRPDVARSLIDAAPSKMGSSTIVLQGSSHGWDLLNDQKVSDDVSSFLRTNT